MPAVQIKNPTLINGVSRQPDSQKARGTCQQAINGYFDEASGFRKRNGIEFLHALSAADAGQDYDIHWMRTGGKRFVMLVRQDATQPIQVFDIDTGNKITINYDSGVAMKAYINAGSIDNRWRILSVFDTVFICNRTVTTAVTGTSPGWVPSANSDGGFFRLPNSIPPNLTNVYQIIESSVNRPAGYYRGNTTTAGAPDPWDRLQTNADNNKLDQTTMPIRMVYDSTANEFNVEYPPWGVRQSGDQVTNPAPSFIGRQIDDIIFHKNRLSIYADQSVVHSRAGSFFNFWRNDVFNLTDSDPIDQFITDQGLNKVTVATSFNQAIVIFTEGARNFQIRSQGPLTPFSINIIPTTNYDIAQNLRPTKIGSQLYFFGRHTQYGQMFEYYYSDNAANNIAVDVSSHVKQYIEDDITVLSGQVNNGLVVGHKYNTDTMYTYKMSWQGRQKVQSAWSKWKIRDNGYTILSSQIFNDTLYILFRFGDTPKLILGGINIIKGNRKQGIPYDIHLDFFKSFVSGTYTQATNKTHWDLPYGTGGAGVVVIPTQGNSKGIAQAATIQDQSQHVTRVFVQGDLSSVDVQIGIPFDYSVTLNKPYLFDRQGAVTGTLALKQLTVYVKDTVQFTLRQSTPGIAVDNLQPYTAAKVDGSNVAYNVVPVSINDRVDLAVLGRGRDLDLTIEDRSQFPCTIVSTEHRGQFNTRTNQQ